MSDIVARVSRTGTLLCRLDVTPVPMCTCGHALSEHTPRADRVFSWPCNVCTCPAYEDEGA
jgi:hypothetical protein